MSLSQIQSQIAALLSPAKPIKVGRVLHFLATGNSLNRFEAERQLHDHTLNSTVSDLVNTHNIVVEREFEKVRGFNGNETLCKRYRIRPHPDNVERCLLVLLALGYRHPQLPKRQPGADDNNRGPA